MTNEMDNQWFVRLRPVGRPDLDVKVFTRRQLFVTKHSQDNRKPSTAPNEIKGFADGGVLLGRQSRHCGALGARYTSPVISRDHCRLMITASGFVCIEDLESMHGTVIKRYNNGRKETIKLRPHSIRVLRDHDRILLGKLVSANSAHHPAVELEVEYRYMVPRTPFDNDVLGYQWAERNIRFFHDLAVDKSKLDNSLLLARHDERNLGTVYPGSKGSVSEGEERKSASRSVSAWNRTITSTHSKHVSQAVEDGHDGLTHSDGDENNAQGLTPTRPTLSDLFGVSSPPQPTLADRFQSPLADEMPFSAHHDGEDERISPDQDIATNIYGLPREARYSSEYPEDQGHDQSGMFFGRYGNGASTVWESYHPREDPTTPASHERSSSPISYKSAEGESVDEDFSEREITPEPPHSPPNISSPSESVDARSGPEGTVQHDRDTMASGTPFKPGMPKHELRAGREDDENFHEEDGARDDEYHFCEFDEDNLPASGNHGPWLFSAPWIADSSSMRSHVEENEEVQDERTSISKAEVPLSPASPRGVEDDVSADDEEEGPEVMGVRPLDEVRQSSARLGELADLHSAAQEAKDDESDHEGSTRSEIGGDEEIAVTAEATSGEASHSLEITFSSAEQPISDSPFEQVEIGPIQASPDDSGADMNRGIPPMEVKPKPSELINFEEQQAPTSSDDVVYLGEGWRRADSPYRTPSPVVPAGNHPNLFIGLYSPSDALLGRNTVIRESVSAELNHAARSAAVYRRDDSDHEDERGPSTSPQMSPRTWTSFDRIDRSPELVRDRVHHPDFYREESVGEEESVRGVTDEDLNDLDSGDRNVHEEEIDQPMKVLVDDGSAELVDTFEPEQEFVSEQKVEEPIIVSTASTTEPQGSWDQDNVSPSNWESPAPEDAISSPISSPISSSDRQGDTDISSDTSSSGPITPPAIRHKRCLPLEFDIHTTTDVATITDAASSPVLEVPASERPTKRARGMIGNIGLVVLGAAIGSVGTIAGLMQMAPGA